VSRIINNLRRQLYRGPVYENKVNHFFISLFLSNGNYNVFLPRKKGEKFNYNFRDEVEEFEREVLRKIYGEKIKINCIRRRMISKTLQKLKEYGEEVYKALYKDLKSRVNEFFEEQDLKELIPERFKNKYGNKKRTASRVSKEPTKILES
jgi:hypothetical protein